MIKNELSSWLFATIDEIIDCDYQLSLGEEKNVQNTGKRPIETFDDSRESGRYHQK